MPIAKVQLPDGRIARFEVPDGTTPDQVQQFAAQQFTEQKPAAPLKIGQAGLGDAMAQVVGDEGKLGSFLSQVGGSVMRTGRALGLGQDSRNDWAALEAANRQANPVSAIAGDVAGTAGQMYLGGRALQGAGGLAGAAGLARTANALRTGGQALMAPANYKQALGAGAAAGALMTEGGLGDRLIGAAAGGLGGAAGRAIGQGIARAATASKALIQPVARRIGGHASASANVDVDQQLTAALSAEGLDFNAIPRGAQEALRKMAAEANAAGAELNPAIARRMADFKAVGVDPLRGWVTREPNDWLAAHSMKGVNNDVTQRWAQADATLSSRLANAAPDLSDYQSGDVLRSTITKRDEQLKAIADEMYKRFRDMGGRDIQLNPAKFNNDVAMALDETMLGSKLPQSVVSWFQKIQPDVNGNVQEPFTFGVAAQRLEAINKLIYNTNDSAERLALNVVKSHLLNALKGAQPEFSQAAGFGVVPSGYYNHMPVVRDGATPTAMELSEAFAKARRAASERFAYQESSPLAEAITSGKFTPERLPDIMKTMRVDDLKGMISADQRFGTNSLQQLRDAAAIMIRDRAVLQSETGGKFSQAGLRRALDQIGPEKGVMLFGPEQWAQYQAILRAGGAMMNQPAGIVANNSGTGQYIANLLQRMPVPGMPSALNMALSVGNKISAANQAQAQLAAQVYKQPSLFGELADANLRAAGPNPGGPFGYYLGAPAGLLLADPQK